jgi:protein-ribulosamine 3-kinase
LTVPEEIASDLESKLNFRIKTFEKSAGGCINQGGKLRTSSEDFFLKWNDVSRFPGMFDAEAKGLNCLLQTGAFTIPKVISIGQTTSFQYLLLEFIESVPKRSDYWKHFGEGLAKLHLTTSTVYGLDHDNYIGSLPQRNYSGDNWIEFLIKNRLQPMLASAINTLGMSVYDKFEKLYLRLPDLLLIEKPSLLHGDLWSGNILTDNQGWPCVIDPSVYFGNREVDLAMTRLFGGFDKSFLEVYNSHFPLISGYERRFLIYQLYPLMVHVNLFGKSYLPGVVSILNQFV